MEEKCLPSVSKKHSANNFHFVWSKARKESVILEPKLSFWAEQEVWSQKWETK
jgi:hypothetical protein